MIASQNAEFLRNLVGTMDENFGMMVKSKLTSYWSIFIMISNLMHIQIALGEMKKDLLE